MATSGFLIYKSLNSVKIGVTLCTDLMVQPSFNIGAGSPAECDAGNGQLLLFLSESWFAALWASKQEKRLHRLVVYPLDKSGDTPHAELLQDIFQQDPFFHIKVREQLLIYAYNECHLVPDNQFRHDMGASIMNLLSGNLKKGLVLHEKVIGRDIHSVYRIPVAIHELFQSKFIAGKYWHFYSLLLRQTQPEPRHATVFELAFFPEKFIVLAEQEGNLLLMQSYPYQQAEDVSWVILDIARNLGLKPQDVFLRISGLIDPISGLFQELEKYFPHIGFDSFDVREWQQPALSSYPSHYFSPFLKVASCV